MELVEYIRLARKWFWLILIGALLAGGISYLMRSRQPDIYQASTKISVGGFIEAPNPDAIEIYTGERLAQNYVVLATTYEILDAVVKAGDFPLTPEMLRGMISTRIIPDTSLLVLNVSHTDPVIAADVANQLAEQLIVNSPSNLTAEQRLQLELTEAEIGSLLKELASLREQVTRIDERLRAGVSTQEEEELQAERTVLVDQINWSSHNLAQFTETASLVQGHTNSLDIVEKARIPQHSLSNSLLTAVLLGSIVGAALAGGVALFFEYLDDTIKTPEQVSALFEAPVLGTVIQFGRSTDSMASRLITLHNPTAPVAEAYRHLRTSLFFATRRQGAKIYLITSPDPADGKSITAANLAVVMATAGMKVLLIDADLRRPAQHKIFGLGNEVGLTTLLRVNPRAQSLALPMLMRGLGGYEACLNETAIPNLRVITSGPLPANPSEILGARVMQHWVEAFTSAADVDVVIFDTPPTLVVADSTILASATGAENIMVLRSGKTYRTTAIRTRKQFAQLDLTINGLVLNNISMRNMGKDYAYSYYYYEDGEKNNQQEDRAILNVDTPQIGDWPQITKQRKSG